MNFEPTLNLLPPFELFIAFAVLTVISFFTFFCLGATNDTGDKTLTKWYRASVAVFALSLAVTAVTGFTRLQGFYNMEATTTSLQEAAKETYNIPLTDSEATYLVGILRYSKPTDRTVYRLGSTQIVNPTTHDLINVQLVRVNGEYVLVNKGEETLSPLPTN